MVEFKNLKEEGNKLFSEFKYNEAIDKYSKAICIEDLCQIDQIVLYKNRAACNLKLEKFSEAVVDCSQVLELMPGDTKALFRRCQAYEGLEKIQEAFKDAKKLTHLDPKNSAIQPIIRRLHAVLQDKITKESSTDSKVAQMFEMAFRGKLEGDEEDTKRKQALNNVIVLTRETAGAERVYKEGGVARVLQVLQTERDNDMVVSVMRVLDGLCRGSLERSKAILEEVTIKRLLAYVGSGNEDVSTATTHALQTLMNSLTRLDELKVEREKHEGARKADPSSRMRPFPFLCQQIDKEIVVYMEDAILKPLLSALVNCKVSRYGRDNVLELLIKFVTRRDGVGWSTYIIDWHGIHKLLSVAGTAAESKTLEVTNNSRIHVSLLLSKVYEDLISDEERESFQTAAESFFLDLFKDDILDSKLEAVLALSCLLQGAPKVGNALLSREGVFSVIMAMADSGEPLYAKYAVEALVQSASKKERCSGVIKEATPILKKLYQSASDDAVKVRALVGLCKLASFGGGDASVQAFADGSNVTLAKACRRFLCNASKDVDLRKWAAEGLAYLSLDATIKQQLATDPDSLRSIVDLAKTNDKGIMYPVAQIFVNLSNSYERKHIDPELLELAKYAKQHVPEEHDMDKEPYISERVNKLVEAGIVTALVLFKKSDSDSTNELLARVYLAVCTIEEHRGQVVQQGGVKTLLPLANEGTDEGKVKASHALAKIAVTQNPQASFPGQRAYEMVRPLLALLVIERSALETFEALLALTNLASLSDSVRIRIYNEKGFSRIEHYCYDEHEELKLAAIQCLCNLVQNEKIAELFKGENDRVKLLVLLSGDDDNEKLVKAASGTLACLTMHPEVCKKVVTCTTQWMDIMQALLVHPTAEVQYRGTFIVYNLMDSDKGIAQSIVESGTFEILLALSKLEGEEDKKKSAELAGRALRRAQKWGLVAHVGGGGGKDGEKKGGEKMNGGLKKEDK